LNADNIEQYTRETEKLCEAVRMWPPQDQVRNKYDVIRQLDLVAARRTISARPVTHKLDDIDNIDPTKVVLKRTHSDMGQHVILPGDESKFTLEYLQSRLEVPGCFWFAQTFVPTLRELGEWKVFLIGGQIVYIVHTRRNWSKGVWVSETPTTYYSLEELRWVNGTAMR
jgi:glutathione synthase/RimK-type ligase-like ATP-grasp enzyme